MSAHHFLMRQEILSEVVCRKSLISIFYLWRRLWMKKNLFPSSAK